MVGQHAARGDGVNRAGDGTGSGELRQMFGEGVVEIEEFLVAELEDGRGCQCLGDGRDPCDRVSVRQVASIDSRDAVALRPDEVLVTDHANAQTRRTEISKSVFHQLVDRVNNSFKSVVHCTQFLSSSKRVQS